MQKIIVVFQTILRFSMLFFLAFVWLRLLVSPIWLSAIISFVLAIIIDSLIFLFKKKNKTKTSLKIKEKEDAENMFLSLAYGENSIGFFYDIASSRHKNVFKKEKYILIKHTKSNVILFPHLKIAKLTPDEVIDITKITSKENPEKIVIVCNEYEKESLALIKNFSSKIILLDKFETYCSLYKEYDFYPEIKIEIKKSNKPSIKDLLAYAFNKSRTKGYIFSSLIIFSSAFFMKQNLYYCIVGSLLLLFAIISFINPKYNSKKQQASLLL